jgi:CDP-6-deoxy-D-xylo-4-hexulose-3-dehydrase
MKDSEDVLRKKISKIVRNILKLRSDESAFRPGIDIIRYAGAVYDHEEIEYMINAILDGWFGVGKYTHKFESQLSSYIGIQKTVMTNSGSSANLLAISALRSNKVDKNLRLKSGDEVLTTALTFPTTLNPIIQNGLVPVFLDVNIGSYNIDVNALSESLTSKTRAIFIPHTLGNPNEMDALIDFAEDYNLIVLEDACDALGTKYDGKHVGTFGTFGTFSFYPAHQITSGEGGSIVTDNEELYKVVLSLRDWGRSCVMSVCNPSICGHKKCSKSFRFERSCIPSSIPEDYDERYKYINVGYNLKPTEIQAAMGIAQLKKIHDFIDSRKRNFNSLKVAFKEHEDFFFLPKSLPKSDPCWFAFPLTIRKNAPFKRVDILRWLVNHKIEVKMLFAGNILKHPAYKNLDCRIIKNLDNSDYIMHNSFFIGVYPGLTQTKIDYMIETFRKFLKKYC